MNIQANLLSGASSFAAGETCSQAYCAPTVGQMPPVISSSASRANASDSLLLLDMDNTLVDTRAWFADFILSATNGIAEALKEDHRIINQLFAEVAGATTLHEYGYIIEAIASRLKKHRSVTHRKIERASERFWHEFSQEHKKIRTYDHVHSTLKEIRMQFPGLKIVVLTDSPEWVTLERLHLTGLLPLVDGIVAIRTEVPKLRNRGYQRGLRLRQEEMRRLQEKIDRRHLQLHMAIPASYAKPSSAGIELAAKRLAVGNQIIIVGDKDHKEGLAARSWHLSQNAQERQSASIRINYVRAHYGNYDLDHPRYLDLASHIPSLKAGIAEPVTGIEPVKSLDSFAHMTQTLEEIFSEQSEQQAA
ncbi:MAG TPA: HAD hydrolase-like protein [Candidatus Obscuribacter sp.]|nr:HAD hydrolase-like protein [Candidatus Obscuribacter sp.]